MGNRFKPGQVVWVSPSKKNSEFLSDDAAVIVEDFETCYLVIQEDERVPSDGVGYVVRDDEVQPLKI